MKWHPPFPKYTNGIGKLSSHDIWKNDQSKGRFLAREDAEPIQKPLVSIGFWSGITFLMTPKVQWFNLDFDIERYTEE